ncbi:hypothetical protein DNTS_032946 [Danionella cerebrum]|uniref:Uncharacterized protein n=1 Tax=Danionella cerebrum TaxID=2873325 RepID=A0A553Q2E6_9TELE|nr:hypothetical protein DNTS_032946 [Danionella translucida]
MFTLLGLTAFFLRGRRNVTATTSDPQPPTNIATDGQEGSTERTEVLSEDRSGASVSDTSDYGDIPEAFICSSSDYDGDVPAVTAGSQTSGYCDGNDDGISEGSVASDVPGPSLVSSNKTTEDICEPLVPPPFDDGDGEHGIQQGSEHKIEVSQAQVCQREDTEDSSLHLTPKDCGARWYVISKGTMAYKPPEYIQSSSFHGEPLMVWLLGILLFNMVFWRNPKKEDLYSVSEMEQTQRDLSDGENSPVQLTVKTSALMEEETLRRWLSISRREGSHACANVLLPRRLPEVTVNSPQRIISPLCP